MKLYRGIKALEFSHFPKNIAAHLKDTWRLVLEQRADGDFSYPEDLNEEILEAYQLTRLQRQHFTDDKEIAAEYADVNNGLLIEIDVPIDAILEHFTIEFQKFAQRRKNFEIVYVVDASTLTSFSKKWKLKTKASSGPAA